jgi:hypothetical protein
MSNTVIVFFETYYADDVDESPLTYSGKFSLWG